MQVPACNWLLLFLQVAGKLTDKVGARILSVIGCVVCILGAIGLALINQHTNYWLVAFGLWTVGVGNGIFNPANGLAGMLSVKPTEFGVASAIRMLTMIFSMMIGTYCCLMFYRYGW